MDFIGKGNFGSVFLGENVWKEREKVAIKLEDKKNTISILKNETRVLEYLARYGCRTQIPQVFWFGNYLVEGEGENGEKHCLVMTYFVGSSLNNISSLDNWMISAIQILEKIHLYGVIHRDLKPVHFIFVEDKQKWVLIDFGFATFYLDKDKKEKEKTEYIIGTPNYISLNIHNGLGYTPIDDIWSLIYIYIRILYPELFVFSSLKSKEKEKEKDEYPQNHILNTENQLRKQRKELFNYKEFWEKFGKQKQKQNNQIYSFIQILLQNKTKLLYNLLCDIFTIESIS